MPYKSEFKQHKNVQYEIWRTTHFEKNIYIIEVRAIFTVKHSKKIKYIKIVLLKGKILNRYKIRTKSVLENCKKAKITIKMPLI